MDNQLSPTPPQSLAGPIARALFLTGVTLFFAYMHRSSRKAGYDDGGSALAVTFAGLSSLAWQDVFVKGGSSG